MHLERVVVCVIAAMASPDAVINRRVGDLEANHISIKAELRILRAQIARVKERVGVLSSGAGAKKPAGGAARVVFRGAPSGRKRRLVPPHRDGPVTAVLMSQATTDEQRTIVAQWSAMFLAKGRHAGAAAWCARLGDDADSVMELAKLLKRVRITTRSQLRSKVPSVLSIAHPLYARGRRRMDLLERLHDNRFEAYSSKRSYGTFAKRQSVHTPAADERNAAREHDLGQAAAVALPRHRDVSARPLEFPVVDWGEVLAEHYPEVDDVMGGIPHGDPAIEQEIKLKIDEIIDEENAGGQIEAMMHIRKMMCKENDPPINEALHAGILPILARCVEDDMPEKMLVEATWVITNICSGQSVHCQCFVATGMLERLVDLVSEPSPAIAQQAAWALGNVAGDSTHHRDLCLETNILGVLEEIVLECLPGDDLQDVHIDPSYSSKEMVELLRNISWLCSNLMRGKAPSPNIKHLSHGARFIGRLLWHPDAEVARDAVWGLSYCVDGPDEQIELLTQRPDVVTKIISMLQSPNAEVRTPALRAVGNIGSGNEHQTQVIIDLGVLDVLPALLGAEEKKSIRKEAMWLISNITAGSRRQIQAVIDANLVPEIIALVLDAPESLRKEAVWAASNFTSGCDKEQLDVLLRHGFFEAMVTFAESADMCLPQVIEGLTTALRMGLQEAVELFEAIDGFDRLEAIAEKFSNAGCEAGLDELLAFAGEGGDDDE